MGRPARSPSKGLLRLRLLMSRLKALGLRPVGSGGGICGILNISPNKLQMDPETPACAAGWFGFACAVLIVPSLAFRRRAVRRRLLMRR